MYANATITIIATHLTNAVRHNLISMADGEKLYHRLYQIDQDLAKLQMFLGVIPDATFEQKLNALLEILAVIESDLKAAKVVKAAGTPL